MLRATVRGEDASGVQFVGNSPALTDSIVLLASQHVLHKRVGGLHESFLRPASYASERFAFDLYSRHAARPPTNASCSAPERLR
jgi:hypothetical protein